MRTMLLASIVEYWSIRFNSRILLYSEVFTRDRFRQTFWTLHLQSDVSKKSPIRTNTEKTNNFLKYIDSKFAEHFIPGKDICMDESVVKFEEKIAFVTYNPKKSTKWGLLRVYVLAGGEILSYYDCSTTESLEKPELPVSSRIPLKKNYIRKPGLRIGNCFVKYHTLEN